MGGVPPLMYDAPNEVYMRLWKRVSERNKKYYEKYPEDVERVKTIVRFLRRFGESTVRLPSEGMLSARRFLQMGLGLGYHGRWYQKRSPMMFLDIITSWPDVELIRQISGGADQLHGNCSHSISQPQSRRLILSKTSSFVPTTSSRLLVI